MSSKTLLLASLCLFALAIRPAAAAAEPACGPFISALKGAAPDKKMDASGESMFTKVCKRNTDAAIKTATECLEKGKGGGNATMGPCLKPLK